MKVETNGKADGLANNENQRFKTAMRVKSRVKAGVVPDSPERWKSQIQIVARGL